MKTSVPGDIRGQFEEALGRETETWAMNSSRNRAGDPGETWVVATKTRLIVGDRGFGGPVSLREIPLKSITGVEVEGGSFGAGRVVILGATGAVDQVCFSALERDDFASLGSRIQARDPQAATGDARVIGEDAAARRKRKKAEEAEVPMAIPVEPARRGTAAPKIPPRTKPIPSSGEFELFLENPWACPGFPLRGVLRLAWPAPKKVRGVRLFWSGKELTHVTTGSGKHQHTHRSEHAWVNERIGCFGAEEPLGFFGSISDAMSGSAAHPELPAGCTEYPFEFSVPKAAPGTYSGRHVDVRWELFAQVDIPRGFDLCMRYPIRVVPPPPTRVNASRGAHAKSVTLDAWVNAGPAGPGVAVTGGLNVQNPAAKNIRAALISVIRSERATASGHTRVTEVIESTQRIPGQALQGDVPFSMRLPDSFCPWRGRFSELSYQVRVQLDVAWAFDVAVSLGI